MRKALILAFVCLLIPLSMFASAEQSAPMITSVTVQPGNTHMLVNASIPEETANADPNAILYLFALSPGEIGQPLESLSPIASQRINEEVTFRFYLSGRYEDRIFAKYQLALEKDGVYVALGEARYPDNPSLLASVTDPYPEAITKKGLQTQLYADAQLLGAAHTVVTVPINQLISTKPTSLSFSYLNRTYYLDLTQMNLLDYKVRRLSFADIRVYLNLVLTAPNQKEGGEGEGSADADDPTFDLSSLYYNTDSQNARFFAYQVENEEAAHLLEGLLRYLTARYTRPDRAYGFAASFILGYEVNSNRYRNYRGPCTLTNYVESYARLVRLAYTAASSVYANARIYVPIANNWNLPEIDKTVTPNALLDYSAHDFLTAFGAAIAAQGNDFPWAVAINPYPSDLTMTDFWNDTEATGTLQTNYITMKNIEVLTNLLASPSFAIGGTPRKLLISEFGVSGQLGTESEALQAAAFAYAYYKADSIDGIEALIWHRQVDRIGENDLYFGLWASDYSDILAPTQKKQIYDVFRTIDADRVNHSTQQDVTAFALPLIGATDWKELIPNFREEGRQTLKLFESVSTQLTPADGRMHTTHVYQFNDGNLYSFYPSDSAKYLELRENEKYGSILYTALYPTDAVEYAGIATYGTSSIEIADQSYIRFLLSAAHGMSDEKISLLVRIAGRSESGEKSIFEGVCTMEPRTWTEVTFPIAEYAASVASVESIRIWIRGHEGGQETENECRLELASVSLLRPSKFSIVSLLVRILTVSASLVALVFVGYLLSIRIRTKRKKEIKRTHRVQGEHKYRLIKHPPLQDQTPEKKSETDTSTDDGSHQDPNKLS